MVPPTSGDPSQKVKKGREKGFNKERGPFELYEIYIHMRYGHICLGTTDGADTRGPTQEAKTVNEKGVMEPFGKSANRHSSITQYYMF